MAERLIALPPAQVEDCVMQGDFPDFCKHQSSKMIEYADGCTDPVAKDKLLKMSAYWLKLISAPKQPTFESA